MVCGQHSILVSEAIVIAQLGEQIGRLLDSVFHPNLGTASLAYAPSEIRYPSLDVENLQGACITYDDIIYDDTEAIQHVTEYLSASDQG